MEQVKNFVIDAGFEIPTQAKKFTKKEIIDIVKMITSELVELAETVMGTDEAIKTVQHGALVDLSQCYINDEDKLKIMSIQDSVISCYLPNMSKKELNEEEIIGEQADAFTDIYYYSLDRTLRHGINMDRFFNIVHEANMSKKGPDGKFIIREDDKKIMKPDGWLPPDVNGEALIQMNNNHLF